ncbi:hypothetical protein BB559_002402 [Furculomyces boomerangus]|uniref:Uncharacterized protein n=1 Tax=Furculomyces boomerangus TaxID=61424 RepID=A0A2T9YVJ2_9FUNG|nr:hypothetical protein BB559_002402 [Furculomyces boomerangus]
MLVGRFRVISKHGFVNYSTGVPFSEYLVKKVFKSGSKDSANIGWKNIAPKKSKMKSLDNSGIDRVPKLAHGLDEILFMHGFHYLQNPVSRKLKYTKFLKKLTQPEDFNYSNLTQFIPPSQDENLHFLAKEHNKKYIGSTSSMTSVMTHLYFLISMGREINTSGFSSAFDDQPSKFTRGARYPASIKVTYRDGVYSINADKTFDSGGNILSYMGRSMEKMLISEEEEYEAFIKQSLIEPTDQTEECYIYRDFENFILRSQLDCRDDRLAKRTFDLKTRAVVSVRLDLENYKEQRGYQIIKRKGLLESCEREYYDMLRSTMIKYNFQVKIGDMGGIFVAYHNTASICGFQYISAKEMDRRLFGNVITGNMTFKAILSLFNGILDEITMKYPGKDLVLSFEAGRVPNRLNLWVEVVNGMNVNDMVDLESNLKNTGTERVLPDDTLNQFSAKSVTSGDETVSETGLEEGVEEKYKVSETSVVYKYTVFTKSVLNGKEETEPFLIKSVADNWVLKWKMDCDIIEEKRVRDEYERFRNKQRTYFKRGRAGKEPGKVPSFIRILREISKRGEKMNVYN